MAGVKITDLPVITGANTASTDVIPIVDVSADVTSKITRDEFFKNIQGNVGIGTSGPAAKLHVVGDAYIQSGTVFADAMTSYGGTSLLLNGGSSLIALTSGTERLRIDASGNLLVGIGTSSISSRIHALTAGSELLTLERSANNGVYARWKRPNKEYILALDINNNGGTDFSLYDATAAATRLTVDGSGNLGLGVTPSAWNSAIKGFELGSLGNGLWGQNNTNTVAVTSNAYYDAVGWKYGVTGRLATHYLQNAGTHSWFTAPSGTAGSAITFTQAMTLSASGNLGVGSTSPDNSTFRTIVMDGGTANQIQFRLSGSQVGAVYSDTNETQLSAAGARPVTFATNSVERARIDASGNLLVGTTSNLNSARLFAKATGDACGLQVGSTSAAQAAVVFYDGSGDTCGQIQLNPSNNTTTYTTSSDYRLKENVAPMQNALDTIAQLNPVTYTWKADGSAGQGFIAHELQAVVPDCVTGEKDAVDAEGNPQYQGVDTSFLVATLVKAIQELKAEVDSLRAQLNP